MSLFDFFHFMNDDFKTISYVKNIKCPILFIYGGKDEFLGASDNKLDWELNELYNSCPSKNKALYLIKDASHVINEGTYSNLDFMTSPKYNKPVLNEIAQFFINHI